jgi:hypothetical protein
MRASSLGNRDLHLPVEPLAQLVERADVVAVTVGERDAPDRCARLLRRGEQASPLFATVVSTSVKPSSSRTRYAFTKRSLVSWMSVPVS